jgi:putative transposase
MMVDYIDAHRDEYGVESICNVLPIAPSSYYASKTAATSARAQRDTVMMPIMLALFVANYRVYGARKLWIAAGRAGHEIGRDQVARLMKALDIEGVTRRRKRVWTTVRDDTAARSPDLVKRNFTATAPNDLWVTDLTYVPD